MSSNQVVAHYIFVGWTVIEYMQSVVIIQFSKLSIFNQNVKMTVRLICLYFQKYLTKAIVLFNDDIVLIKIYINVFTTCNCITICELLIYSFN